MASILAYLNESNSTPKTINRNKYLESAMDFATPMSTLPNRSLNPFERISIEENKISSNNINNSVDMFASKVDLNNNNSETIVHALIQKFNEHTISFRQALNHLDLLDGNLRELSVIIDRLRLSMKNNSLLESTTEQIETRLLQMTTKREQIRTAMNESPSVNQALKDIIQQISPSTPKSTTTTLSSHSSDPMTYYAELVTAVQLSMNQKTNLIGRMHHERVNLKHRTNECRSKVAQRRELLLWLADKILQQTNENKPITTNNETLSSNDQDLHTEQMAEWTKLVAEYRYLQDENRTLKQKAKQNIKTLYGFISQTIE